MTTTNFDIMTFLKQAIVQKASDVHIRVGEHPAMRIAGTIVKFNLPALTEEDMNNVCKAIAPDKYKNNPDMITDLDFSFERPQVSRFRVNINRILSGLAASIRLIPCSVPSLEQLQLPATLKEFAKIPNGLILVTGATSSGNSTTISAMINDINLNQNKHIITIEDPVEFLFKNEKSIISQRQAGVDTKDFYAGTKYALRQDPDVLFLGEIRDRETIEAALNAAETGHLVFSTIHTNGAVQTVNRVLNMFEASTRDFIRMQLSKVLRGTVSQRLVPSADGKSRVAACEILVVTSAVQDYIERNKLEEIYELMQGGAYSGMMTMNFALYKLYKEGKITAETAVAHSDKPNEIEQMMRGVFHGPGYDAV